MNILMTTDKRTSAIDRIANGIASNLPHHNIKVLPVHPKRPSNDILKTWESLAEWADVLDFRYWKTAVMLLATFPKARRKPSILCHYNPYDLTKETWDGYDLVTVCNETMQSKYPRGTMIPLAIDLEKFKYNKEYTKEKVIGMSVSRIESKKGVEEVATACKELGYKFLLVGRVSEPEYVRNMAIKVGDTLDFREDVDEKGLVDAYKEMAVLVCNSVDNYESGTLPILEAMASGVPVLTRDVGHVPDIYNGKNMVVRKGSKDDVKDLKEELEGLMASNMRRDNIREAGWQTVKNRDERRIAISYDKLWHRILHKEPLVSVIVPTANRPEVLVDCLASIIKQDYPSKELVVVDDGDDRKTELVIKEIRKVTNIPIKYVKTGLDPERYGLTTARNIGIINSIGDTLVFCDDRLRMEQGALSAFSENTYAKKWMWGEKDGYKKGFVENFSSVRRRDIIDGGMFNERIDSYGGITQEVRTRFHKQGMVFEFTPKAKAIAITKSSSRWNKREDIINTKTLLWKLYG